MRSPFLSTIGAYDDAAVSRTLTILRFWMWFLNRPSCLLSPFPKLFCQARHYSRLFQRLWFCGVICCACGGSLKAVGRIHIFPPFTSIVLNFLARTSYSLLVTSELPLFMSLSLFLFDTHFSTGLFMHELMRCRRSSMPASVLWSCCKSSLSRFLPISTLNFLCHCLKIFGHHRLFFPLTLHDHVTCSMQWSNELPKRWKEGSQFVDELRTQYATFPVIWYQKKV